MSVMQVLYVLNGFILGSQRMYIFVSPLTCIHFLYINDGVRIYSNITTYPVSNKNYHVIRSIVEAVCFSVFDIEEVYE